MSLRLATAIAFAAAAASTALPVGAATADARSCSTTGLVAAGRAGGHGRVVGLRVTGLTCAKARGIARTVAGDVIAGKPVSLSGLTSCSESQTQCTGCASTTRDDRPREPDRRRCAIDLAALASPSALGDQKKLEAAGIEAHANAWRAWQKQWPDLSGRAGEPPAAVQPEPAAADR
jgi:hypothetical protein